MSMNQTPSSERVHIGFFGRRNAGKSSVMNAVTGQDIAVVSDVRGTTTDPVYKSMELLPLGPVVMMDTPGIDDEGELGTLRVRKSYQVLNKTDAAVLVIDGTVGAAPEDMALLERIREKKIPYVIAVNKKEAAEEAALKKTVEQLSREKAVGGGKNEENGKCGKSVKRGESGSEGSVEDTGRVICVSAATGEGIPELKELIASAARMEEPERYIVRDLLDPSDMAVLVMPIDKAAPKGRLILPQQQTIRDILEADAVSVVVKETELKNVLGRFREKPKLVITDSQAFEKVAADTPDDILLTSFSILFARYNGDLASVVKGVTALDTVEDGDVILISEGCTHHRQCDDIGTVKLPRWIREYTGKEIRIETTSGTEFPDELTKYKMIIHCGGCMLNEREMKYRLKCAEDQGVPMTNYGIAIAFMKGILKRSVEVFPEIYKML